MANRGRCRIGPASVVAILASSTAAAQDSASPAPGPAVQSVVISGQKFTVQSLIDRKIYSVREDLQSTFGTASDVLGVLPSVDVDSDGIVSLRGDPNVLILIDGKPTTLLSGQAAGDNLQSIPAQDIERIEILTTPPAQFKADGAAGVINIVMRKKHRKGLDGSMQGSLGSGGRSVVGGSGGWSGGALSLSATAGYRRDYRQRLTQSDVRTAGPGAAQVATSTINETIRRAVPTLGALAEYALSDRQTVSASMNWSQRGGLRTYTEVNDGGLLAGPVTSATGRLSSGHDPQTNHDEKLGFSRKLGRPGETLDFSLHRSASYQYEHYDYVNDSFIPPGPAYDNNLSFREHYGTTELGADYALPIATTGSMKLGYAFEQDDYRFANLGNNVDPLTGVQIPDPALTNDFEFRQRINAAYMNLQAGAGAWNWLGGVRLEATNTDGRQLTSNLANSDHYLRAYPSLHVDRSLSGESTLSFGASLRVNRPDPRDLNPYVDYEYTPNLVTGNAHLKPQFTQSYEAGYEFDGPGLTYGLTGYYRRNRDSVTPVTEYLGNGLSLTTKTNLPRNDAAGVESSLSGRIVQSLSYGLSGNLFHSRIDATALGISGLRSTTGLDAKAKLDYRPTEADTAQMTVTRTDRRLTPQGYVGAINLVNLGYRHRLTARLSTVATVSDVFNGQRYQRTATTPTFTEDYRRIVRGRVLYVGLQYSFGSAKQDKPATFEYDQAN